MDHTDHREHNDYAEHGECGACASEGEARAIRDIMTYLASVERRLISLSTRLRHVGLEEFCASCVLQEFALARLSGVITDMHALLALIVALEGRAVSASISPQEMRLKLLAEHTERLAGLLNTSGDDNEPDAQGRGKARLYEAATAGAHELNTLSKAVQGYVAHWLSANPERVKKVLPF